MRRWMLWFGVMAAAALVVALGYGCGETTSGTCADNGTCTDDGGATLLKYDVDAQVGGKIAQVGARLIQGTAKKLADQFFGKFAESVGAPPPVAAA